MSLIFSYCVLFSVSRFIGEEKHKCFPLLSAVCGSVIDGLLYYLSLTHTKIVTVVFSLSLVFFPGFGNSGGVSQ